MLRKAAIFSLFFSLLTGPAWALEYSRDMEAISQLNRIQPLQNPEYDRAEEILGRRILDRKNKVVGEVRDVVLKPNGNILLLRVDFDRLRLSSEVFLNYRDMSVRPATNGYALAFASDQVESLYPTLLANIATAAGEEADSFSLQNTVGKEITARDGRRLGIVSDVLFGSEGARAEALYVTLKANNMIGKTVAIPISMAEITDNAIMLENSEADAMIQYVKAKQ